MKDYLVMLFASLTVILCLARSGYGTPNDFMDYKRDPRTVIRSATLDRQTLKQMLTGLARERAYLVDPDHYQQQKRQMNLDLFTTFSVLREAFESAKNERDRASALAANGRLFAAGGRR
uniref:Corticotropin-releasing hormone 2 n=1 Tax=Ophionotus victoriae TaxID=667017 RepID=A0A220W0D1_9ECHI|nr:corticotropin-releasing hormone 2 precursor [Ophionotus victoriae]